MHATVRNYSGKGSKELISAGETTERREGTHHVYKGLRKLFTVRTADGGFSVSVYQDKVGADESMKKAREWIGQNASATGASVPTTSEGSVVLHA